LADDEFSLRRDAARAAQAQRLLDDEMLTEAFATLRQAYIDGILGSKAQETDTRERLWLATTVLTKVRGHLEQTVSNGKVSKALLADLEQQAAREKRA